MELLLFSLTVLFSAELKPVCSVKACFFCADVYKNCYDMTYSASPQIMYCEDFEMRNHQSPKEFIKHPARFRRLTLNEILAISSEEMKKKMFCITVHYRFSKQFVLRGVDIVGEEKHQNLTLQSCVYRGFEDESHLEDSCKYNIAKMFAPSEFDILSCKSCDTPNCNSASTPPLNWLTIFTGVFMTINLQIYC